jgi:uncharacterized protein (TIGR04255 family)
VGIEEVFPNPTVKQVIFQIKYPNLFYIENKIPEMQLKIMEKFPASELRYSRVFSFGEAGPDVDIEEIKEKVREEERNQKIWTFRSPQNFELNILSSSLSITSRYHKTYNLEGGDKFRDIIIFAVGSFLDIVAVPIISRIGLRYIDECPIESKDNKTFRSYYNSAFPIDRFSIENAEEMNFRVTSKIGDYYLNYGESLRKKNNEYILGLDFDGYTKDIEPKEYLEVTDRLHEMISKEFEKTIKEPLKEYMRKKQEV